MVSLAAETIFHIGSFPVTNTLINAVLAGIILIILSKIAPNAFEAIVEMLLAKMDEVTGDKKKTRLFFPFVGTIFLFLLTNNWLGLIPGTGTVGFSMTSPEGVQEIVPFLRSAGADLNMTLALAVLSIVVVQIAGIVSIGFVNYFSKFINVRGVVKAVKHGPMAVAVAGIEFFVGIIEIVSEVAKAVSLSLRLFGNVFAGEVLIGVMMSLAAFVVPVPFMFLEILVGVIQATVFAMLVLVFLNLSTMAHGEHEGSEHGDEQEAHAHA